MKTKQWTLSISHWTFWVEWLEGANQATRKMPKIDYREVLSPEQFDLVVTFEGMESVGQTVDQAESFEEPGIMLNTYRDFAVRYSGSVFQTANFKK